MKLLLLAVVVIVGVLVVLSLLRKGTGAGPVGSRPPGTRHLDEETAVRPDIDPQALAAARAQVAPTVPDAVLSDALLDATPSRSRTCSPPCPPMSWQMLWGRTRAGAARCRCRARPPRRIWPN
ncbi:hypothetical protein ACXXDK_11240 [Deinococcus sp. PESE-38]